MKTEKMIGLPETGARAPSRPDPAVPEKALRRRFGAEYKARILREADQVTAPGQFGGLLQRDGLYSSYLAAWRKQRDAASLGALAPKRRGHKATPHSPLEPKPQPLAASPRALNAEERQAVLDALHSVPLADKAPAEAYATLLDEGKYYYCATRTMELFLNTNEEVRERRDQLRHTTHAKPQLKATTPNQVWSWDITKLLGPDRLGFLVPGDMRVQGWV